jgi:hypothetical protein
MRRGGGAGIAVTLVLLLAALGSLSAAAPPNTAPVTLPPGPATLGLGNDAERGIGQTIPVGLIAGVKDLTGAPGPELPTRPEQPVNKPELADPQARAGLAPTANPVLRPGDSGWVAQRLAVPALGINVAVFPARPADELFPPYAGAYIHSISAQPGRGTNSYLFAHAVQGLFLPLWYAQVGQEVLVQMTDGQVLRYVVTRVVRDVPCPDPTKPKPPNLPPALANATHCDTSWMMPTPSERLTLQTSQGFNRNYGELVIVAEPAW